jgi:hypothetical protein
MPLSIDIFNKKILSKTSRFGTFNVLLSGDAVGEVTQIIPGSNVTISPTNGKGVVTINAAGGGGGNGAANEAFSCELTLGSLNGLVLWNLAFDTIGGFANSRFTVPSGKAGLYMFNAAIFFNLPNGVQIELGIYRNNNRVRAFYVEPFDGVQGQAQVFGVLNLNVGDVIDVRVNFFGDQSAFVRTDAGVSWFTAVRL